jgi:hypothetical protein
VAKRTDAEDHWLARPETVRRLWLAFLVVLAATVAADLFIDHQGVFGIDGTVSFFAWYGFLACVVLVVGARGLGTILKRRDDYYGG